MIFLQPYFLFGLLAVSIPIIIHLFHFRRYKTVYFTNVSFLRNLKKETEKQSKLKHLLVLLARILAIIALVAAFAQPVIPEQEETESSLKAQNFVSIYVDNSRSMQLESGEGNLLAKARTKARGIIDSYPATARFQFLSNDFKAYHQRFFDRSRMKNLVDEVSVSPSTRQLSEVVSRQKQLFSDVDKTAKKHIYLLSDFQNTTADIDRIAADSSFNINLVKIKANQPNNLYIDSCWFEEPVRQLQQTSVLHVKLKNSGVRDYEKIPLKLKINGEQRALASFSVKAGQQVETELSFTNRKTGWHQARLEIVDNPVTFDDVFYFSYEIKPAVKVLEIFEDNPSPHLARLFRRDSLVRYTSSRVLKLNYSQLADHHLIILNQVQSISSGLIQTLKQTLSKGQTDIVILPDFESISSNRQMADKLDISRYTSSDSSSTQVVDIATSHPLYENVFMENIDLTSDKNFDLPVVHKHYSISRKPGSDVLMRLLNDKPFLLSERKGNATIYQLATPLGDAFTNLQRHALFVPTFHRMAVLSQKSGEIFHYTGGDRPVNISMRGSESNDQVVKLQQVNGEYEIIPPITKGPDGLQMENKVKKAGHYRVQYNDSLQGYLSFNYNRVESDLEMLSLEEMNRAADDNIQTDMTVYEDSPKPLQRQIEQNRAGYPLWRWFVVLALVFLGFEVLFLRFLK
ncbi:MAG: BatA domain-containing protein [Bacteroidales bacterium]|nr:BatA domain-containing protein [Bacteroidales bacterium]MCF8332793.1 BatA domain-containing protein [Bacteroidales bacterium]